MQIPTAGDPDIVLSQKVADCGSIERLDCSSNNSVSTPSLVRLNVTTDAGQFV